MKCKFLLISPTLNHYRTDHSSLLPWLSINFHYNSKKPGSQMGDRWDESAIHLWSFSLQTYMYSSIRIVNPYPHQKQLNQRKYSAYIQFLVPLVSSRVTQVSIFPPSPSGGFLIHLQSVRLVRHSLHSFLGSSNLLKNFFLIYVH